MKNARRMQGAGGSHSVLWIATAAVPGDAGVAGTRSAVEADAGLAVQSAGFAGQQAAARTHACRCAVTWM
ncbi:MAG TPA: hypothetical protein VF126_02155 [Acidobacteriaceae bacterium]